MGNETFNESERRLLDTVPSALRSGVELYDWWRRADVDRSYGYRYDETSVQNRPDDTSYGFFDTVDLSAGLTRVNGNVQEMFYDEPKAPPGYEGKATDWVDEQIREFILKYFMRVSDYRRPQPLAEDHPPPPPGLGFLSQCPQNEAEAAGFGFSQLYYKRTGSDGIGKFADSDADAIVDLRRVGEEFEWIVLKNPISSFSFDFKPFGVKGPQLRVPAQVFNYLVLSPEFVINEDRPEAGVRGRYGFGYAFVNDPEPSVLGYGPGQLEPAFEQMVWEVHDSGEIKVRATFVAEEPKGILNLSIDPFAWGFQFARVLGGSLADSLEPMQRAWNRLPLAKLTFDPVFPTIDLLNFFTADQAAKRLCISKTQLIKEALFIHFLQHYQAIVGSLRTWRQIPDWTAAEADLPKFVVTGKSA